MPEQLEKFSFGRNWNKFIQRHFSEERVEISRKQMLEFLSLKDMLGIYFLDVGCGSGLHSLAAFRSGAGRIVSYDVDAESVMTTRKLREYAGSPASWEVLQGSVLDDAFVGSLAQADIVYSWGVLHHTGDMWKGMDNCLKLMKDSGVFFAALYDYDIQTNPSAEFWLDVKRRYNQSGWFGKQCLIAWYYWHFLLYRNLINLRTVWKRARSHKRGRGMALYTDVVDWLGGWPMEFAKRQEVKNWALTSGLEIAVMVTGKANTEYLFRRVRSG
jgi:2-polyprenyl-6-hydroxyphenyl methylase/3-demethylubiquinone-9 3-methyltransferase